MQVALEAAQIVISTILVVVILMQSRGSGFGGAFGTQGAVFRTRRGIERYLFRGTVVLAAVFVVISLLSARAALP
ncbi:MAG: preprotein translocase subunit SecG [Chloroflexi bacterium]|nr:preprotein translocase subunit SecG [Chloroflexota bacterium]